MGAPFWKDHYESQTVAAKLRHWWREPFLIERVGRAERIAWLANWMVNQEMTGCTFNGVKHPILCLAANDLIQAWGNNVAYVWSFRPLAESVNSLERRNWQHFRGHELQAQRILWLALNQFLATHSHICIPYSDLVATPRLQIERLVDYLSLNPREPLI